MAASIEITIPILDEEETLDHQIRKIRSYLDQNLFEYGQIVIVIADNGSKDGSPAIARRLEKDVAGVRYLRLEERGVGRALKASWGGSDADFVGYMDLDLATDLKYVKPALDALIRDGADVVAGSRLAAGAVVEGRSALREFTSRVFNLILKVYLGAKFSDGMCGFKFLRRSVFDRVHSAGADSEGWFFATEVLVVAEKLGLRLIDLPVKWVDDPNSKVKIVRLSMEYLRAMRRLKERLAAQA